MDANATSLSNRLGRLMRRFSLRRPSPDQIERWTTLEAQGAALDRLMASGDWPVIAARLEVAKRFQDVILHAPHTTEGQRHDAAVAWTTLHAFERDLRDCVREGKNARETLQAVKQPP